MKDFEIRVGPTVYKPLDRHVMPNHPEEGPAKFEPLVKMAELLEAKFPRHYAAVDAGKDLILWHLQLLPKDGLTARETKILLDGIETWRTL